MAGGKETPRQKLINLMYLVLLAMLALQVSSAIIQKFEALNESLEVSIEDAKARNKNVLARMQALVEQNKNDPNDVFVLKKTTELREKTQNILDAIALTKKRLITITGGLNEHGKLVGAKEEEKVAQYMLGSGESENGEAYALQKELNNYVNDLNTILSETGLSNSYSELALDGKEDPLYKNDESQRGKDFAHLNFEATPLVAALAVLSEKENKILSIEGEVLNNLIGKMGGNIIPVDKVRPVVMASSNRVVAGTEYEAEMFMAAFSSNFKPKMTFEESDVDVSANGTGKVSFKASGGAYNDEGIAKKTWTGTITYPTSDGKDSVYRFSQDYYVVKPNIEFKSAAIRQLYVNSENKMMISVPALGTDYNPTFRAVGATIHTTNRRGEAQIVPARKGDVDFSVYNNGVYIGKQGFKAIMSPMPDVEVKLGNREMDLVKGISTSQIRRLNIKITPNENYKKLNPRDVNYRPKQVEVLHVRNGRVVSRGGMNHLRNITRDARKGDNIVIEIKKIERKNFKGAIENIPLRGKVINISVTSGV